MSQSASHYSISQLIARIVNESGLRRSAFVKSLGYKSVEGGLRKLDELLEQGRGDKGCLQRIMDAYRPDPGELERALAATDQMHQREHEAAAREAEERQRRRFRPFIWVHTADGAHSVLSLMFERKVKVLWLPGLEHLPESKQLETVQRRIREHYQEMGGKYAGFGQILKYRFADSFDTSIVLDSKGEVIEAQGGRFLRPEAWFELQ
jgi:hypothetical protein